MGVLTKKIQIILFHLRYGLVFYSDYLLQISFKVRYNLFRIILPTDSHPFWKIEIQRPRPSENIPDANNEKGIYSHADICFCRCLTAGGRQNPPPFGRRG
jgi:hypothetical protein